jgi:bacterioferritin
MCPGMPSPTRIAERIDQLGALPSFDPATLSERAHARYVVGEDLVAMLREDLVAERVAVQTYTEIVRWLGDADPTTHRLMEDILAQEEEHADDLASLLERVRQAPRGLDA